MPRMIFRMFGRAGFVVIRTSPKNFMEPLPVFSMALKSVVIETLLLLDTVHVKKLPLK